jgi:uncharacterized protein (TIGR02145 family)
VRLTDVAETVTDDEILFNGYVYGTVQSPDTDKIWLDRNLGATQVCTARDDNDCYGDYYQWGRAADGHEHGTSDTQDTQLAGISTVSTSFITINNDWTNADTSGASRQLASADGGDNDVCPPGYVVPSDAEYLAETSLVAAANINTAYASFLKIPVNGMRFPDGNLFGAATMYSVLWTNTPDNYGGSMVVGFSSSGVIRQADARSYGHGVRCIGVSG